MMSKQFNSRGGSYSGWVRFHFYWPIWHRLWNNVFKSILHIKFKLPLWQFLRLFQLIMELQWESELLYTGGLFTGSPSLESESPYSGKKPDQNLYLGTLHNHTLSWTESKCRMQGISPQKILLILGGWISKYLYTHTWRYMGLCVGIMFLIQI